MAYTADINIVVKGQAAVNKLQRDLDLLGQKLDEITKRRIGPSTALQTFNTQLQEAARRLNEVAAGTSAETEAIRNYVTALGNANAASKRQNDLIEDEIRLREAATNQTEKLAQRQQEFTARTNEAAQAAHRQTAEFYRQQRLAKQVAQLNANAPAAQLLLAPAAPGAPAMGGGARRRITGSVERLGGARTVDEAAMALRFAQALQQQVKPLSQIDALYAGIAGEAAKLQTIRALPSTEMLNAAARGLQTVESIENRRFTTAQRRAQKLQQIQDYYGDTGMANAGYGAQGPAVPPAGIRRRTGTGTGFGNRAGGAISSAIIGGGFPLLFGQGPAAAAGGALGGLAGGLLGGGFGFALSIAGTAIGDLITQSETLSKSLASLNSSLSTTGSTSITTASDIKQLAKDLNITNDEALQLVGTFSQFGSAQTREALASLFGGVGGAATFEAIARAGIDEKEALNSVFELRKYIGNEAATQLALQLNTVGATQTQATLLKLIVERSIQNSVATAKNVQFTDNLLSTWENIVAGIAGALSLAIQFIQKMREGSLLRLPFLDQVANMLGGVKARSGKQIAEQRGSDLEKRLRAEIEAARKAVQQETGVLGTQAGLQRSMGGTRKEDRTPQLKEELQALKQIGEAENNIRDLKFQGKNLEALAAEKTRAIADIERDRNKALLTANNANERALYIQIANQRIANLNLETADKERDIRQQIFEEELRAQEAVRNAVKPFTDLRKEQELQLQYSKTYSRLVNEGMLPAEAERIANFEKLVKQQLDAVAEQIKLTDLAIIEAKARGANTVELEKQLKIYKDQQKAIQGAAAQGPGKGKTPRERLQEAADEAKGRLNELIDPINIIKTAAQGIGDAFAQSFEGIVTGTMTAQEALANFFKSIGDMFVQMAAKIIAEMITMYTIKAILGLFGNGGTFGQGTTSTTTTVTGYAANGALFSNGIAKFAAGSAFGNSIVNSPTLFKFADGGATNLGVMGEAGPEAIMPLRRNASGRLGVDASGLRNAMGAAPGSATGTPVINMSFETSTINGVEYVSRDQLEAAMAQTRRQATRDGAKRGMTMTLDRIQQSPQTRSRIGIR